MEEKNKKSVLMQILESNLVTVLITVVLGGIIGQSIITSVQNNAKRNELALTDYRKYLEQQISIVQQAYDLVGRCISNAHAVISLTQPKFQLNSIKEADQKIVSAQKKRILESFNSINDEWQRAKYKTGLLISYYHYGQTDVLPAWRHLQNSVDEMIDCAYDHYTGFFYDPSKIKNERKICKIEINKVVDNLEKMSKVIEASQRFSWQQMSIPKQ